MTGIRRRKARNVGPVEPDITEREKFAYRVGMSATSTILDSRCSCNPEAGIVCFAHTGYVESIREG